MSVKKSRHSQSSASLVLSIDEMEEISSHIDSNNSNDETNSGYNSSHLPISNNRIPMRGRARSTSNSVSPMTHNVKNKKKLNSSSKSNNDNVELKIIKSDPNASINTWNSLHSLNSLNKLNNSFTYDDLTLHKIRLGKRHTNNQVEKLQQLKSHDHQREHVHDVLIVKKKQLKIKDLVLKKKIRLIKGKGKGKGKRKDNVKNKQEILNTRQMEKNA